MGVARPPRGLGWWGGTCTGGSWRQRCILGCCTIVWREGIGRHKKTWAWLSTCTHSTTLLPRAEPQGSKRQYKIQSLTVTEHTSRVVFDTGGRVGRTQLAVVTTAPQCVFRTLQKHTGGGATGECMATGCQHGLVAGIELCTRKLGISPPCPRGISRPSEIPWNTCGHDCSVSATATTGGRQGGFVQGKGGLTQWALYRKDQIGHVWVVQDT